MSCADSLRLVQGVLEVNEIKSMREELRKLREENALLKKELDLWKNDCELPVVGEYYTAPNELLQLHGWEFDGYAESMALRYSMTGRDGKPSAESMVPKSNISYLCLRHHIETTAANRGSFLNSRHMNCTASQRSIGMSFNGLGIWIQMIP